MKNNSIILVLIITSLIMSCTESPKENAQVIEDVNDAVTESITESGIPFLGTWSREFSMGEGMDQTVSYIVSDTEIMYKMVGARPMEYNIVLDEFNAKDNRWIGKKGDDTYVIFVKDITEESISLFKKKAANKEEALTIEFPSDTARSKFTSWNVYNKVK